MERNPKGFFRDLGRREGGTRERKKNEEEREVEGIIDQKKLEINVWRKRTLHEVMGHFKQATYKSPYECKIYYTH